MKSLSRVQLFATPWTVDYQAPPSMGFSRQKCWSGLPFPSPGALPDPGIEPRSPALQVDALPSEPRGTPKIKISLKKKKKKVMQQYASKFGKLSSVHRTGKGQFSFQSQRKAMPKNAQTTAQLHSSHTLVK